MSPFQKAILRLDQDKAHALLLVARALVADNHWQTQPRVQKGVPEAGQWGEGGHGKTNKETNKETSKNMTDTEKAIESGKRHNLVFGRDQRSYYFNDPEFVKENHHWVTTNFKWDHHIDAWRSRGQDKYDTNDKNKALITEMESHAKTEKERTTPNNILGDMYNLVKPLVPKYIDDKNPVGRIYDQFRWGKINEVETLGAIRQMVEEYRQTSEYTDKLDKEYPFPSDKIAPPEPTKQEIPPPPATLNDVDPSAISSIYSSNSGHINSFYKLHLIMKNGSRADIDLYSFDWDDKIEAQDVIDAAREVGFSFAQSEKPGFDPTPDQIAHIISLAKRSDVVDYNKKDAAESKLTQTKNELIRKARTLYDMLDDLKKHKRPTQYKMVVKDIEKQIPVSIRNNIMAERHFEDFDKE